MKLFSGNAAERLRSGHGRTRGDKRREQRRGQDETDRAMSREPRLSISRLVIFPETTGRGKRLFPLDRLCGSRVSSVSFANNTANLRKRDIRISAARRYFPTISRDEPLFFDAPPRLSVERAALLHFGDPFISPCGFSYRGGDISTRVHGATAISSHHPISRITRSPEYLSKLTARFLRCLIA